MVGIVGDDLAHVEPLPRPEVALQLGRLGRLQNRLQLLAKLVAELGETL